MNCSTNKRILSGLLAILCIAYPFIVYYFSDTLPSSYLLFGILGLLLLRVLFIVLQKNKLQIVEKNTIYLSLMVIVTMLGFYIWDSSIAPLFYPVVMSLSLVVLMGFTLLYPPSMIERFARILEPDLDEKGVRYTRKVTIAWMLFGLMNGTIAWVTVVIGDRTVWALYNGLISYVLIGLLMGGEYIVRCCVKGCSKNGHRII